MRSLLWVSQITPHAYYINFTWDMFTGNHYSTLWLSAIDSLRCSIFENENLQYEKNDNNKRTCQQVDKLTDFVMSNIKKINTYEFFNIWFQSFDFKKRLYINIFRYIIYIQINYLSYSFNFFIKLIEKYLENFFFLS